MDKSAIGLDVLDLEVAAIGDDIDRLNRKDGAAVYCTISARRGSADAGPHCLLKALAAAVNKEKREPART
jgi:hypothetical protein